MKKRKINVELLRWYVFIADAEANKKITMLMREKGESCDPNHTLELATMTQGNLMLISAHTAAVTLSDKTVVGRTFFVREHDCSNAGIKLSDEEAKMLSSAAISQKILIDVPKEVLREFEGAKMKEEATFVMRMVRAQKKIAIMRGSKSFSSFTIRPLFEKYRDRKVTPSVLKGFDKAVYEYVTKAYNNFTVQKRNGRWVFVYQWRMLPIRPKKK
jgi:hypothetical protein